MNPRQKAVFEADTADPRWGYLVNARGRSVFEARQKMRLGVENPVCVICGESNPLRLMRLKKGCSFLSGHHITGVKRDPGLAVILCLNCHQELHLRARLKGVPFGPREGSVKALSAARIRAVMVFLEMLTEHGYRWADELEAPNRGNDGYEQ